MPTVNGLLSGVNGLLPTTGTTAAENGAISQLTDMGQAGNPYAGGTSTAVNNLLNGGGANNYAPQVTQANNTYQGQVQPLASNTNYDPMSTPGIGAQLQALQDSITGSVNGSFAAAGRDGSGFNQKALGAGLTAGMAPVLTAQYNQNVQNQQNAAQSGFNANATTAGTLAGMQQNYNNNQNTGINAVAPALNNSTWGPQTTITAQQLGQSIPASNLGLLANIGIPLAGLGTNSNGTIDTTKNPSILDDISSASGSVKNLGGLSGMGQSAASAGSGIMGLLGLLSDRRAKEDIEQVGMLFDGTPVYRFRYIGDDPTVHIGLMAQDVEKDRPEAVTEFNGFKRVDYKAATDRAAMRGPWGD